MRHVSLTCKNHPKLRWSCKEIAFSDVHGYNGCRNIFFMGEITGKLHEDCSGVAYSPAIECPCPPTDLIRSPEDKDIYVQVQIDGKWTYVPQAEAAKYTA